MIRIGTSGWQYDDWRGRFYPEHIAKNEQLRYYAQRFPAVEVNSTFYRLPEHATVERWRDETPADFVLAVKGSRYVTHIRRLRECAEPVELLWSRIRVLGEKLGPVLFQLPPRFPVDIERLSGFVAGLPGGMRAAFEFRDPSWFSDDVFATLDAAGCAVVLADTPGARVPDVVTGGWSYLRFHRGQPDAPGYTPHKLRRWARRIETLPAQDIWVFFNNDTDACAPADAEALRALLDVSLSPPPGRR